MPVAQLRTDLLPASPIGVGDDIEQRFGQVAIAVEGIVPPTDGYVGEVPARGDGRIKLFHGWSPLKQVCLYLCRVIK